MGEPAQQKIEERRTSIQNKGRVRELVFGVQDGTISTVGLLAGIQTATDRRELVLLAGITAILSGAISMAAGAYLSACAERDIVANERKEGDKLANAEPYLAQEGVMDALVNEGLAREQAYRVVRLLSANHRVLLTTFQEKVFGFGAIEINQPLRGAAVMAVSFILGGVLPLLPYLVLAGGIAPFLSAAVSAIALFGVGAFKGHLAAQPRGRAGVVFFVVAVGAAGAGYLIGLLAEILAPGAGKLGGAL